jgi:rfaE bifunctional protein kinase chain/domain
MKKDLIIIFGNFNILHPGHLRLFRYAKSIKKDLWIGLLGDNMSQNNALISEQDRLETLQVNSYVDECFIVNESIADVILKYKPYAVLKGKEYEQSINAELEPLNSYGGKLIFGSGDVSFSSIDLLRKEYFDENGLHFKTPKDYILRHNITEAGLLNVVDKFTNIKACILGDIIIDEYIDSEALGMSQEDPTIAIKPLNSRKFIGGAGIVAMHGEKLGANVNFMTVTGEDEHQELIQREFKKTKITSTLFSDRLRPTNLKSRYRARNKTLLRVNNISEINISEDLQLSILSNFEKISQDLDVLIFSDFNYGFLPTALISKIIDIAEQKKILVLADSQSSSQTGNIARFKSVNLITPTEREARISQRDNQEGLVQLAMGLLGDASCKNIFLKLGEEGVLLYVLENGQYETDQINALNSNPVDTAGAGDSLLITSALCMASGATIWETAIIGSLAAAIQVSRVGNIPITREEVQRAIKSLYFSH